MDQFQPARARSLGCHCHCAPPSSVHFGECPNSYSHDVPGILAVQLLVTPPWAAVVSIRCFRVLVGIGALPSGLPSGLPSATEVAIQYLLLVVAAGTDGFASRFVCLAFRSLHLPLADPSQLLLANVRLLTHPLVRCTALHAPMYVCTARHAMQCWMHDSRPRHGHGCVLCAEMRRCGDSRCMFLQRRPARGRAYRVAEYRQVQIQPAAVCTHAWGS